MAHWKIERFGASSTFYICSHCGKVFDFLYTPNIYREDCCLECGAVIDEENEYIMRCSNG